MAVPSASRCSLFATRLGWGLLDATLILLGLHVPRWTAKLDVTLPSLGCWLSNKFR